MTFALAPDAPAPESSRNCDERCIFARSPLCSCKCGGKNHQRGFFIDPQRALELARHKSNINRGQQALTLE